LGYGSPKTQPGMLACRRALGTTAAAQLVRTTHCPARPMKIAMPRKRRSPDPGGAAGTGRARQVMGGLISVIPRPQAAVLDGRAGLTPATSDHLICPTHPGAHCRAKDPTIRGSDMGENIGSRPPGRRLVAHPLVEQLMLDRPGPRQLRRDGARAREAQPECCVALKESINGCSAARPVPCR